MNTKNFQQHTRSPDTVARSTGPLNTESRLSGPAPRYALAFTLLELLVVLVILGIIAGLALPVLRNFKPNYTANATRTMLNELARARQLAITHRTTVYMVFVPTNYWSQTPYKQRVEPNPVEKAKGDHLLDKQMIGYNFVSLRSLGDQPGRPTVHYLSSWKTLPEGAFIAPMKFAPNNVSFIISTNLNGSPVPAFAVFGFDRINTIPFPSEETQMATRNQPYVLLPCIGFDYMGRLVSQKDAIIPLAQGSVLFARDKAKQALEQLPSVNENPPGNWTNSYNLIAIDWLTGRARGIQQEVK